MSPEDALALARALHGDGVAVSLERRLASSARVGAAGLMLEEVRELLVGLGRHAAPRAPDVVLLLPALATPLATDVLPAGHARSDAVVLDRARQVCRAARNAGVGITVDTDDRLPVDRALGILRDLRKDFPETGVVVRSGLRRAEADCHGLAHEGSRVRLAPGALPRRAARPPMGRRPVADRAHAAYGSRLEDDRSFVRCIAVLMAGQGTPTVATGDPALLRVARALAGRHARAAGSYDVLLPARAEAQRRALHEEGESVRVLVRWGAAEPLPPIVDTVTATVTRAVDHAVGRVAGRAADLTRPRHGTPPWPAPTDRTRS